MAHPSRENITLVTGTSPVALDPFIMRVTDEPVTIIKEGDKQW